VGGHLDERVTAGQRGTEGDGGDGAEGTVTRPAGPVGQVHRDVVPAHVEQARPLDGFVLGEVPYSSHVASLARLPACHVVVEFTVGSGRGWPIDAQGFGREPFQPGAPT